jgi:hypothetical protein
LLLARIAEAYCELCQIDRSGQRGVEGAIEGSANVQELADVVCERVLDAMPYEESLQRLFCGLLRMVKSFPYQRTRVMQRQLCHSKIPGGQP